MSLRVVTDQVVIRSLLPQPTVLAGPSDQGHFPDDFRTAAYDHVGHYRFWQICWPLECWYGAAYYT